MNLESFMIEDEAREVEYIASKRFINKETGKPEVWKLKSITADENDAIRKQCFYESKNGKRITKEFDTIKYLDILIDKCVVFPDLHNVKLLDHYHEMDAIALLKKHLLNPGEYDDLTKKIQEVNGYDLEKDVEEAKN